MRTELVSIGTDTVPLDGVFYEPDARNGRAAVLLMHGNVGNFYSGPSRFLPAGLVAAGFACLAFNRRGHDILVNQVGRRANGGAFQTAAEGMADNAYAADFLASRGFVAPVVIGHSNGGMLAACFAARHRSMTALVLLSAHAGGPDTYGRDCAAGMMAAEQAAEFVARARSMVANGCGEDLLLLPNWWYLISAASLVDRVDNTPDLLEQAGAITCPSLAVRGSKESATSYPMEEFARRTTGSATVRIVDGGDHSYVGKEAIVTEMIVEWLASLPSVARDDR